MAIKGYRFTYANQSSETYGVIKCDIDSIDTSSNDEESSLITSTTAFKKTWDIHGIKKEAPLQFKLTVCQPNGDFIDTYKERELKGWLCKNSYNWLTVDQEDFNNIAFYCQMSNPQKVNVARDTAGISYSVTCDSQFAWTNLKSKSYSTVNGDLGFNMNLQMDFDEDEISPVITITPSSNGNIFIANTTIGQIVKIENCVTNEVIVLDGNNGKIKTSIGGVLLDRWNKQFLTLRNGKNNLDLTGNFTMKLEYRLPIRIGG
jgi:phage-related protein